MKPMYFALPEKVNFMPFHKCKETSTQKSGQAKLEEGNMKPGREGGGVSSKNAEGGQERRR